MTDSQVYVSIDGKTWDQSGKHGADEFGKMQSLIERANKTGLFEVYTHIKFEGVVSFVS